jgi:hypothetical protein
MDRVAWISLDKQKKNERYVLMRQILRERKGYEVDDENDTKDTVLDDGTQLDLQPE